VKSITTQIPTFAEIATLIVDPILFATVDRVIVPLDSATVMEIMQAMDVKQTPMVMMITAENVELFVETTLNVSLVIANVIFPLATATTILLMGVKQTSKPLKPIVVSATTTAASTLNVSLDLASVTVDSEIAME